MSFSERCLDNQARREAPGAFVTLTKGIVHYEVAGDSTGPPVVLISGFSSPMFGFDPLIPPLVDAGFYILRFDLFGRGYSDRLGERYTLDLFIEQLLELKESIGFPKCTDIIGWSMGGAIALKLALERPLHVARLALIAPSGLGIENVLAAEFFKLPLVGEFLLRGWGDQMMESGVMRNFHHPECFSEFRERFKAQVSFEGSKLALLSTLRETDLGSLRELYLRVGVSAPPTCFLWGREDRVCPLTYAGQVMIPGAEFWIFEDAGHAVHWEATDALCARLIEYLQRVS